ncbi:hypothetical protein QVD17_37928 [Tagetes erecta]|uniref:Uncharacterized protein n=1 Tax=Tagetes erecta TaxID=13708 RepID=A0AAD8JUX4_TARER|nr:hypothetical protein QVD17_37928 [Tagetes erecta]
MATKFRHRSIDYILDLSKRHQSDPQKSSTCSGLNLRPPPNGSPRGKASPIESPTPMVFVLKDDEDKEMKNKEQGVVRRGGKRGGGEEARGRGWLLVVELGGGRKVRGRDVARRRWDEMQRGWPLLRRGEDEEEEIVEGRKEEEEKKLLKVLGCWKRKKKGLFEEERRRRKGVGVRD